MGACGATAGNVKPLLPPRQSRGISHVSLEELGASHAGFSREIDHPLERIAAIGKQLGMDKKIAA